MSAGSSDQDVIPEWPVRECVEDVHQLETLIERRLLKFLSRSDEAMIRRQLDSGRADQAVVALAWLLADQDMLVPVEVMREVLDIANGCADLGDLPYGFGE